MFYTCIFIYSSVCVCVYIYIYESESESHSVVSASHPYMTTGKTGALALWIFVGKVMSLLLNMLSRFVMAFLPRSKYLLISWLQSPSAVILEPKKIRSVTVFIENTYVAPTLCQK